MFFTADLSSLSQGTQAKNPRLASALHFVPCHCFRLAFFYFCQSPPFFFFLSFFPHTEVVAAAAAAGFLPEQFFKLFTRRLAALTLCLGSISRGDILPALPCSPAFALLLNHQVTSPCNRLHAISTGKQELIYDRSKIPLKHLK